MIDLLPFLLQKVACKIHRLGGDALQVRGSFSSLPIYCRLLPMVHGITAIDRLYPIKPKQPV